MVHYLKAASRTALIEALVSAGMWNPAEQCFVPASMGDALDEIGVIRKPTGNSIVVDGVEQDETAPVDGWHANLMLFGDVPPEIAAIAIPKPNHPVRVFAE